MKNNSRKYSYFDPLRDEIKAVVFILNNELLNDLPIPKSFSGEQIIIKMLGEARSTNELQISCI